MKKAFNYVAKIGLSKYSLKVHNFSHTKADPTHLSRGGASDVMYKFSMSGQLSFTCEVSSFTDFTSPDDVVVVVS